jgi:hypothetical protein
MALTIAEKPGASARRPTKGKVSRRSSSQFGRRLAISGGLKSLREAAASVHTGGSTILGRRRSAHSLKILSPNGAMSTVCAFFIQRSANSFQLSAFSDQLSDPESFFADR